jgi:predicted ATPase
MIVGPRAPAEELPPKEAQNRLHLVFRNLVRVLAGRKHPLVVFLDDLQWADRDSCQLISQLAGDPGLGGLLVVLAGRDNEISAEHPVRTALAEMENNGTPVQRIPVTAFDQNQTVRYVSETLGCSKEVRPLANILYRKTGGNPFFLGQLLSYLQDNGLLTRDAGEGCWIWDPADLNMVAVGEDIIGFMLAKLAALPAHSRDILKVAACMGNVFDPGSLSLLCGTSTGEAASVLETPQHLARGREIGAQILALAAFPVEVVR